MHVNREVPPDQKFFVKSQSEVLLKSEYLTDESMIIEIKSPTDSTVDIGASAIIFVASNEKIRMESSISGRVFELSPHQFAYLSFPVQDWQLRFIGTNSNINVIAISIKELHGMIGHFQLEDPEVLESAMKNFRTRDFCNFGEKPPAMSSAIHQLFNSDHQGLSRKVFLKGKLLEFLSCMLNISGSKDSTGCPYITSDDDLSKIEQARTILKDEHANPPTTRELARRIGTNELKLKMGFKHVYGNTLYGFLADYRMELAKSKLTSGDHMLVKEIAGEVGYSNPSHFIAAFKKKYGITPKQYLRD